jgi:hypothetical protein
MGITAPTLIDAGRGAVEAVVAGADVVPGADVVAGPVVVAGPAVVAGAAVVVVSSSPQPAAMRPVERIRATTSSRSGIRSVPEEVPVLLVIAIPPKAKDGSHTVE